MSATPKPTPVEESWTPSPLSSEVERARAEDPEFRVVLAKALAKGRNETYRPERHGPFDAKLAPRIERQKAQVQKASEGNLQEIIDRFMAKAKPARRDVPAEERNPYLRAVR